MALPIEFDYHEGSFLLDRTDMGCIIGGLPIIDEMLMICA